MYGGTFRADSGNCSASVAGLSHCGAPRMRRGPAAQGGEVSDRRISLHRTGRQQPSHCFSATHYKNTGRMKARFPIWRRSLLAISAMLIAARCSSPSPAKSGKTFTLSGVTLPVRSDSPKSSSSPLAARKKGQQQIGRNSTLQRTACSNPRRARWHQLHISHVGHIDGSAIQIAEAAKFVPCAYDNFVWFTDEELIAAARKEVPLFDGSLLIGGELPNQVSESLEHFLQEHSIKGGVSATLSAVPGGPVTGYGSASSMFPFRLNRSPSEAVQAQESLAKAIPSFRFRIIRVPVARGVGQSGLTEAYQDEGYLQAKFSDPQVVMKDPQGHDASLGVTLIYDALPGPQFHSTGVTWSGNSAISESDLSKLMEVKPGTSRAGTVLVLDSRT